MRRCTQFASDPASGRESPYNKRDGSKSRSHLSAESKHQSLLPGALSSSCLDLRTVKRLSKLVVSPCQEKPLHRERLASHGTVRYYFFIALGKAKQAESAA
jgi:hypothetical protein